MTAAVGRVTNDVFVSALGRKNLQRRGQLGRRLGQAAISQFLASLRRFFRDLQTKAHAVGDTPARRIPRRVDPREALATPEHVEKALAGSEPRDIALAVWQRLAIQAARLTPEDLGPLSYWPFSAVQALAFLWVSTARRQNELLRLRANCVRTRWEPEMSDETGDRLPPGAEVVGEERGAKVSYLHIPPFKYGGPGWIWIPKYTADAIARWQAERGQTRLALFDQKDREFAQLLFVHRAKGMGFTYVLQNVLRCFVSYECQQQDSTAVAMSPPHDRLAPHAAKPTRHTHAATQSHSIGAGLRRGPARRPALDHSVCPQPHRTIHARGRWTRSPSCTFGSGSVVRWLMMPWQRVPGIFAHIPGINEQPPRSHGRPRWYRDTRPRIGW